MELVYCVVCGGKLANPSSDGAYTCKNCSRKHYKNPKTAASVYLFNDEGEVLFGVRTREPQKGKLHVIGGFVELDENLEEALYREIKEEIGLEKEEVTPVRYIGSGTHTYEWGPDTLTVLVAYYVSKLKRKPTQGYDDIGPLIYKLPEAVKRQDLGWDLIFDMLQIAKSKFEQDKL